MLDLYLEARQQVPKSLQPTTHKLKSFLMPFLQLLPDVCGALQNRQSIYFECYALESAF